ncbi:8-oxo-dGTP diphosphatase MutT [Vibrio sp. YMD68]|uniref:8-oxo-dGTP diphosphatase MutT n=1 Tax=Vibrio sp. YMD68 TaxID=3042300 RepID=UPI00249C5BDF|nr:8-oxo-dGTP diphosphatase MutT [Vibrio sp. YMD68]WGW00829.1 8-oxo-dGTP diphosphatase MutT [Vibrio sp. YMD68]
MKRIHIVAAIIFNSDKSKIYITQRPEHLHKGGFWEFPGGKVEQDESIDQAMIRELHEEIGISVTELAPFHYVEYDYPEKSLKFDFITITDFNGEPYGKEGQLGKWVGISELNAYRFPEANLPTLEKVIKEFA